MCLSIYRSNFLTFNLQCFVYKNIITHCRMLLVLKLTQTHSQELATYGTAGLYSCSHYATCYLPAMTDDGQHMWTRSPYATWMKFIIIITTGATIIANFNFLFMRSSNFYGLMILLYRLLHMTVRSIWWNIWAPFKIYDVFIQLMNFLEQLFLKDKLPISFHCVFFHYYKLWR